MLVVLIQTEVEPLMPAKESLMVKQVDGDRRIRERGLQNRYCLVESTDGERPHNACMSEPPAVGVNNPVARQKDTHIVTQSCQFFLPVPPPSFRMSSIWVRCEEPPLPV